MYTYIYCTHACTHALQYLHLYVISNRPVGVNLPEKEAKQSSHKQSGVIK